MTNTKNEVGKVLVEMLSENTGKALCDSGDAYGRHWQKNIGKSIKDWESMPEVTWSGDYYTINVYHYLKNGLELDDLCRKFNKINSDCDNWDAGGDYHGVSKQAESVLLDAELKVSRGFNSYNGESALSQVIQGTWFNSPGTGDPDYLLLQIHQGCDVRGGYTNARLFYIPNYSDGCLLEDVYGIVTKPDGTQIQVDNMYNGHSMTDEDGKSVDISENDKVELSLMTR
jgi:hypothetical protein